MNQGISDSHTEITFTKSKMEKIKGEWTTDLASIQGLLSSSRALNVGYQYSNKI